MAIGPLNSVSGFSVGDNPKQDIILANGDITTINFTANGVSSLGPVGNVKITGGTDGQYLSTDGNGNLSFSSVSVVQSPAPMPIVVYEGETLTIANNYQGLFGFPLTIEGNLVVDGILIDVNDNGSGGTGNTLPTQVQYISNAGTPTGSNSFTYNSVTGTLSVPNVSITGNIIPTANVTYSLGNNTNRFSNLYLAGNTIDLGGALISANATSIIFTNPAGGTFAITGATTNSNLGNLATANYFAGNGNGLANIQGANVSGAVAYATTANSVAGGNVSGAVAYATTANSVAGANVSGAVAFASVANSVSAANISGAVSLANYATVANSVAGSNVSGAVNLATYASTANAVAGSNVSGAVAYATTANSVAGANVSGQVTYAATANSVAGANVSGQVNYAATANSVAGANVSGTVASATTAGTVTTAAQPNITSVGTLSSLDVTANITGGNLTTTGTGNVGTLYVGTGGANINGYTKITGNIDVTGNFNVTGNLNYQNVTDLIVGDPLIYLAANAVGDSDDIGIVGNYNNGTYQHTGVARDHTDGTWKFFSGVVNEPTTTIDWANAQYPSVKTGNLFSANITGTGWANITGNILAGNANLGNAVTANYFIGSGANLTSITGANVTGAVAYATTANSVAGANVTGAVAFATTANAVAGSNVSGAVAFATTANSVAGSNVSGAVNLATFAGTANAVAGANVSGTVSLASTATIAGTVTTAAQPNITSVGTLSSVAVTANGTFGNVYANTGTIGASLLTGTLTTAAQPNVTSTGTLTSLTVTGNITGSNQVFGTNHADSGSASYNVNLGSGGLNGRGAVAGYSGGAYGGVGYNIKHTGTTNTYDKPTSDQTSYLRFDNGGFNFLSNSSTTAATSITLTSVANLSNAGAFTVSSITSGNILPSATSTYNLGSTSARWANIYTSDLSLSNEGMGPNEIDGTTGNWTIQEGAEDLFIINNRTGKKYKFALTEITDSNKGV